MGNRDGAMNERESIPFMSLASGPFAVKTRNNVFLSELCASAVSILSHHSSLP
jgi:hypothetical protein